MIQHCLEQDPIKRGDGPFAIVMAPTRELAQQIEKEAKVFSRSSKGFKTTIVVGGTNMSDQRSDLRQGVEVCVATPGRLIDHLPWLVPIAIFALLVAALRLRPSGTEAEPRAMPPVAATALPTGVYGI